MTAAFNGVDYIASYRPAKEPRWDEVRDFVCQTALLDPARPFPSTHRLLRALTRLALFCLDRDMPLDPETCLNPDVVAHFLEVGVDHGPTARAYRADIKRVAVLATKKAPWVPRQQLGRTTAPQPYTSAELEALVRCVATQPTQVTRQAGRALIALGLGAGLDGRWAGRIGPADMEETSDGLFLHVQAPFPRRVLVLPPWDNKLLALSAEHDTACFVGQGSTSQNRVTSLVKRVRTAPPSPPLVLGRLRATYLLQNLISGTPLPDLLEEAGLKSLRAFDHLVPALGKHVNEGTAPWSM